MVSRLLVISLWFLSQGCFLLKDICCDYWSRQGRAFWDRKCPCQIGTGMYMCCLCKSYCFSTFQNLYLWQWVSLGQFWSRYDFIWNSCFSLLSFLEQPSVTIHPPIKTFQSGNSLSIKCRVNGFPAPSIMWYREGFPLQLSERIIVKEGGELVINNAQLSDAGDYECTAWNIAGQSQASVNLMYTGKTIV